MWGIVIVARSDAATTGVVLVHRHTELDTDYVAPAASHEHRRRVVRRTGRRTVTLTRNGSLTSVNASGGVLR